MGAPQDYLLKIMMPFSIIIVGKYSLRNKYPGSLFVFEYTIRCWRSFLSHLEPEVARQEAFLLAPQQHTTAMS